jgi:hypothetical protein
MSSLFALDAARQFLSNVIEIGGQLEKQRISIGAILGDTVKANHLFSQIKDLALKSPFGVVELDQYTKQLSAYGFKYNELFDMTKRLADISAGAGTDIGRLTLALGHVRSATYLTGITLRQFSMNNIPMLKMLADYYTEIEKKAVSTADVQKRISQRKVSYEDVIEQILDAGIGKVLVTKDGSDVSEYNIIYNTLQKDPSNSEKDAVVYIYRQLRNADPADDASAREVIMNLFFSEKRYDLGDVGRYRLNKKLNLNTPDDVRVLTKEDIIEIIKYLIGLINKCNSTGNIRTSCYNAVGFLLKFLCG